MTQPRIEFEHGSRAVAFAKSKRQPVSVDLRDWSRVIGVVSPSAHQVPPLDDGEALAPAAPRLLLRPGGSERVASLRW